MQRQEKQQRDAGFCMPGAALDLVRNRGKNPVDIDDLERACEKVNSQNDVSISYFSCF